MTITMPIDITLNCFVTVTIPTVTAVAADYYYSNIITIRIIISIVTFSTYAYDDCYY